MLVVLRRHVVVVMRVCMRPIGRVQRLRRWGGTKHHCGCGIALQWHECHQSNE
jgi:hypothetical protein